MEGFTVLLSSPSSLPCWSWSVLNLSPVALIAGKQMETGPAEEDFSWACGHCFFERRKKFAIKDYLIRQVCRKSIGSKKSRGQAGRAKLKRHLSCDCAREKDESIRGKTSFPCKPPGRQIFVLDVWPLFDTDCKSHDFVVICCSTTEMTAHDKMPKS